MAGNERTTTKERLWLGASLLGPGHWQAHLGAKYHLDGPREEAAGEGSEQLRAHLKSAWHISQAAQLRPGRLQLRLHLLQQLLGIRQPRARVLCAAQGPSA